MKVLFVNTVDTTIQVPGGGDAIQMRETQRQLEALGVEVVCTSEPAPDAAGYDLAHMFNIQWPDKAVTQIRHLRAAGVPVIVSPIYWDPSELTWAMHIIDSIWSQLPSAEERRGLLVEFGRRVLGLNNVGYSNLIDSRHPWVSAQREIMESADMVLVSGSSELRQLQHSLRTSAFDFRLITNGVAPETFSRTGDISRFRRRYKLPDDFVLSVCRWCDPRKNVLMLAEAVRDIGLPIVLAGRKDWSGRDMVVQKCLPPGSVVLDYLDHTKLPALYAAATIHGMPSWYETPGLSSLEAALMGLPIVVGNRSAEVEYFGEEAFYCDPASVESIRWAVECALRSREGDCEARYRLKERILERHTWRHAAERTLVAYRDVLAC